MAYNETYIGTIYDHRGEVLYHLIDDGEPVGFVAPKKREENELLSELRLQPPQRA